MNINITIEEFKKWCDENKGHFLVDVREPYEIEVCSMGGNAIPMDSILSQSQQLPQHLPIVIHCNSGKRSDAVCYALRKQLARNDIYSLTGGIQAYAAAYLPQQTCAQ
jgi:sulfur-carrier protein adenylyltransferase/sulfurtransferase